MEKIHGPVNDRKCYTYIFGRQTLCPWCRSSELFASDKPIHWLYESATDGKVYDVFENVVKNPESPSSKVKISFLHDITKSMRTEQSLQDKNEQMLNLINATPDFICFKDGEGRWLLANKAGRQLFLLEGVDYVGKTDAQLAEYSEFYREAFLACQESDEISWRGKNPSRCLEKIPQPDDGIKTYDIIKVPLFHADGRRKGLVVIGRDITEDIRANEELQKKNKEIHDTNIALRVVLDRQKGSQEQLEQQMLENLKRLVFPYIKLLDQTPLEEKGREYVHLISAHLHSLMDSFCRRLDDPTIGLTSKELLVADMVRQGKSSADIAKLLNLTIRTVEVYRNIIRKKLKISGKKINLHAYLQKKFS